MSEEPIHTNDYPTRAHFAVALGIKLSTLTYFAYGKGKSYTSFEIIKKSGGTRTIQAPVVGLRVIQLKLNDFLAEYYKAPLSVQGFVKGGSVLKNASLHLNKKLVLNLDLKDFFPSINTGRVIGLLKSKPFNFDNEIASLIAALVTYENALPQGAPTSPLISNMVCRRMDGELRRLARHEKITYSRYADDITFSTNDKNFSQNILKPSEIDLPLQIGNYLTNAIRTNGFDINTAKTRLQHSGVGQYVTGVKVNTIPNLRRKYVRQIRAMLHAWEKYGPSKAQSEFTTKHGGGSKSFEQVVRGKLAYLQSIKGDHDPTYATLQNKFVELEGKGRKKIPVSEVDALHEKVFIMESGANKGTGFILDKKWLITCSHVKADEVKSIEFYNHWDYPPVSHRKANIDKKWNSPVEQFDILALPYDKHDPSLNDLSFISAPWDFKVIEDTNFKVVGFPAYRPGIKPHIMPIHVNSLEQDEHGHWNAFVDKKLVGGYSGSPVLNDKNQVVGIVQRGTDNWRTGDNSIGYTFLPIQEMRQCFKEFES